MRKTSLPWSLAAGIVACCLATPLPAGEKVGEWTRFRGPDGAGISDQKGIPVTWSPGDYAWNVELPGVGHSSPVIWKHKVFVTSAVDEGAVRFLHCLDVRTGKRLWTRSFGMNRSHKHLKNSWASGTPCVDGERVYVPFADKEHHTLSAYDLDGNLVWRRFLGRFESQHGQGVSPIIFEEMVIIPNDQRGPSSVVALDRRTGEVVWSTLRPIQEAAYATPRIIRHNGTEPQLICCSGGAGVSSLDPYTGQVNWTTEPFPHPPRNVSSPVYAAGLIFQTCGGGGKGNVMHAVDPAEPHDASRERMAYKLSRTGSNAQPALPYVPTPIACGGYLFLCGDSGVFGCIEPGTGRNVWTRRVGGNYSGSPVCIDGKIYIISEDGEVVVFAASSQFRLLGRTRLGDDSHSTPALAGGRLFLRTFHRLACLEARPDE